MRLVVLDELECNCNRFLYLCIPGLLLLPMPFPGFMWVCFVLVVCRRDWFPGKNAHRLFLMYLLWPSAGEEVNVEKPCINTIMLHKNDSNSILSIPALIWVLDDVMIIITFDLKALCRSLYAFFLECVVCFCYLYYIIMMIISVWQRDTSCFHWYILLHIKLWNLLLFAMGESVG